MNDGQGTLRLYGYFSSVQGNRDCQEDCGFVAVEEERNGIGIVCDGIGGLPNGSAASLTAVESFLKDFATIDKTEEDYSTFLKEEMYRLDAKIYGLTDEKGRPLSAGTTLAAVVIDDERLSWVSVGDSKIYVVRGDTMAQCNREHNYLTLLNDMLKDGVISLEMYESEVCKGDSLTSFIGMGNLAQIDVNPYPFHLRENDVVLLYSDGLSGLLSQNEILSVVRTYQDDLESGLKELQKRAEEKARSMQIKQDNTTIVLLSYGRRESG